MREPKQLIEECKKHLRNTDQYKHEYKKDIRKLITALEKQLAISGVSICLEQAKKYARHQHFLGTQGKELVEFDDWKAKD